MDTTMFNDGFGTVSQEQLDSLLKSLNTGTSAYNAAPNTLTQGTSLMVESLDSSLRSVTFSMKNLRLWPMIPKDKAYNTVEEYNRQTSYGESSNGSFFDADAGTAPSEHTSSYNRQIQVVRYMGTTRIVTHPLTLIRPAHGPVIAQQIKAGTMYLLQNLERQLFEANGMFQSATGTYTGAIANVPTNSAKFNGLEQQIRAGNSDVTAQYSGFEPYGGNDSVVVDLDGTAPDEDSIEDLANRTLENFGMPTDFFIDNKTHRDLNKIFYPKERIPSMGVPNGKAGFVLSEFISSAGSLRIVGDVFLRAKDSPLGVAQSGAPATPVVSSTGTEVDANSEFGVTTDQPAGTYSYRVSAVNNVGESLAATQEDQAITAGNRVTVVIAAGTTGALYYAVYRAPVGTTTGHKFIGYVSDSLAAGGGGATFRDAGHKTPGAPTGYMLEVDTDNISWKQLAPLMKMDLAITGPAYRWMQLLYGTPIVYAPLHHGLMENIGRSS